MTNAEALIKAVVELYGLPYLWDGKGFDTSENYGWNDQPLTPAPYLGVDCSGTQTLALLRAGGPDLRLIFNAARMAVDPLLVSIPEGSQRPGDLALYARPDGVVHHVMAVLYGGLVIGSAGGDETTLTKAAALARGAGVQVWSHRDYMQGFIGTYRRWQWAA